MTAGRVQELLLPYLGARSLDAAQLAWVCRYLDLIVRWNMRTNLTGVREPELILQRQIGESLFASHFLPDKGTLLDFGSGAGFPGIPLAILFPNQRVTLAESQGKKASFLRETVRELKLPVTVWAGRVEALPVDQLFGCVAMRAVDQSARMLGVALRRVAPHGRLLRYLGETVPTDVVGWVETDCVMVPCSRGRLQMLEMG